ncbi:uncharacterized protein LOC106732466 isoform X2 [Pelodiscus sinensis]|uniref:uncharacterized protein LOC106732466 isoform X2 n=1 Tax=Pelodiscus sinensis TaxID=13735 RepID=UPI003F6CBB6E
MSWPGEAWQEGLPARALQGVRELEQRLEWATKERVQKQAQLDTLEAALHKQRQKHEEERGTWALLAQERRDLAEACERLERGRQQLSRELQAKGAQLSQLEGQLGRATQRIEELEEELRRCQAELDNLRLSTSLTHCWAPHREGPELGTWGQLPRLENRSQMPSMRLQPSSLTLEEEQPLHHRGAWHSVPPGGPAPPEDSQGIPPPGEEPREENEGPGCGPPDTEAWESRGQLQSVQQELAQCTEQRDQAVSKVSALQGRVQQLLEELRGQRQKAGAAQRRLEQQERKHHQELAELEQRHREELKRGPKSDIPVPPTHPPDKGRGGSAWRPPGCGPRSLSTSRLERAPEKREAAGKVRGPSARGPRAMGTVKRGREPGAPAELLVLRAEVLELRQHLATSESLRKRLLETCCQLRQGAQDQAEEHWALAQIPPAQDATTEHKEEETQKLLRELGPGLAKAERVELQALVTEEEAKAWGAPGPGLPGREAQEVEELQVLRGELRALSQGKAEAEAQAVQAQERLRWLQETLGLQTERLALACEAQSRHVAELLTEGHEREQELERLGQALGEASWARGQLEAEVRQLRALLGRETPPTSPHEPPSTVPEPGPSELPPTASCPSPPFSTVPGSSPAELPGTGSLKSSPTAPQPNFLELPLSVPEASPPEMPLRVPEPGSSELLPAAPPSSFPQLPPTDPEPGSPQLPPTDPEPGSPQLPPTDPEPGSPQLPPTDPRPSRPEPLSIVPEPRSPEMPPTHPELSPLESSVTVLESSPPELPPTLSELPPIVPESGSSKLASPTPPELPCSPELPLPALELAVTSKMWAPSIDPPLLMDKQAWHSEQVQQWEPQRPAGQAGLQKQEVLSHLLQENQALRTELMLWQSQGQAECAMSTMGDRQYQETSATLPSVPLRDRGCGDLAYVLQTPWPGTRDAQTQTEGSVWGGRRREFISVAFDHTHYEPYGLPEVVMKGFADIPSGPSCPYVLRRGILGSTPLAQLMPRAEPEEDPTEPDMGTSV